MRRLGLRGALCALSLLSLVAVIVPPNAGAAGESCPNGPLRQEQAFENLPNCRADELVSPPLKNGGDVAGLPTRTRVAADGNAVQYASLGGFGDARGTNIATEYMAIRTAAAGTNGWTTHAITPGNLEPGSVLDILVASLEARYASEFTPDLNKGVFFANTDFTQSSQNVSKVPNLFLRSDLRTAGPGAYQLLSKCPACSGELPANPDAQPGVAGASADFSHVIFESSEPLTGEAAPCTPIFFAVACPTELYEWSGGVSRLAGWVPPAGETQCGPAPLSTCVAAGNSEAGRGAANPSTGPQYTPNTISQDGSRVIFSVNTGGAADSGRLYMRVNNGQSGAFTVQLNASERTAPDVVPADATYWGASGDGSRVIFTTKENLIDGDNTPENNADLYEYDVTPDAQGHHLKLLSPDAVGGGANVQGVIGEAVDGRTVYFVTDAQLVQGQPTGSGFRIFRSTDGNLRYVTKVSVGAFNTLISAFGGWGSPQTARVTPDGNHLLFLSQGTDELPHSGIGDSCPDGCFELFLYDATANGGQGAQPVCVSCAQPDAPAQTNASFLSRSNKSGAAQSSHLTHPLSDNGRFVFFDTGEPLLASDQDGVARDVYEYDSASGQLHLLSPGKPGSFGATFADASPSGSDAFFVTRDKLSPWDVDDNVDLYDARVDGGMPGPQPSPPACVADACRASQGAGPVFETPASTAISGDGNARMTATKRPSKKKVVRCRRGTNRKRVHGKVRCVKVTRHKKTAVRVKHASVHAKGR